MRNSNIQREDILPSEKAKAYSMKYNAIKHQGKKGNSLDAMKEQSGDSKTVIQRYIQLAALSDDLLEHVDAKKLGFTQGVELSHLSEDDQSILADYLRRFPHTISIKQAEQICENGGRLSEKVLHAILTLPDEGKTKRQVKLGEKIIRQYFPETYSENDILDIILSLLDQWTKSKGGQ